MASIFRRMFKVAESNAHAAMDNLEDPIKMTEQGVRDLKKNLQAAISCTAMEQKEAALQQAATAAADHQTQQGMADQLQGKVEDLKRQIGTYENEAITLKARARTASSMRKINQQLAGADASGSVALLEKMKQKVQEEESLAEAYQQLSDVGGDLDEDIDKALATPSSSAGADSLAALKAKMGIAAPA